MVVGAAGVAGGDALEELFGVGGADLAVCYPLVQEPADVAAEQGGAEVVQLGKGAAVGGVEQRAERGELDRKSVV